MTDFTQLEPYALSPGEGKSIWFLGTLTTVKAAGEHTRNAFALIEQLLPPGFAPPPHVHEAEEEAFYLLDGELTISCGDRTWKATAGSFVLLPRGIIHGFTVEGSSPAKVLVLTAPAGFEKFVKEVGEPAREPALPPARPPEPADVERLIALAAKYNIEIKGPPP